MIARLLPLFRQRHRPPSGRDMLIAILLLISGIGIGTVDCQGQGASRPSARTVGAPLPALTTAPLDTRDMQARTRPLRTRLLAATAPPSSDRDEIPDPHFGRALFGSTLGAGVGTGLGLLLLRGASAVETENRGPYSNQESPEEKVAGAAVLIGIASIVAGGPLGAVHLGDIERRRTDAYVGAAVGEFVFGVLGYVAANRIRNTNSARLMGLGTGVAVGSAAGAVLVASQERKQKGALRWNEGTWSVGTPDLRVRSPLSSNRSPAVDVTLLSVRW